MIRGVIEVVDGVAGFLLATCGMVAGPALTSRVPGAARCLELCMEGVRAGRRVVVLVGAYDSPV